MRFSLLSTRFQFVVVAAVLVTSRSVSAETLRSTYAPNAFKKITKPMLYKNGDLYSEQDDAGDVTYMIYIGAQAKFALDLEMSNTIEGAFSLALDNAPEQTLSSSDALDNYHGRVMLDISPGWHYAKIGAKRANVKIKALRVYQQEAVAVATPVPTPVSTPQPTPTPVATPAPTPIPGESGKVLKAGQTIAFGGMNWGVQTDGVVQSADYLSFKASTGEFAQFDPVDGRKIRNEVAALTRFEKNKLFTADLDLVVRAPATPHKDLQWFIPVQIHQADTRNADGANYPGSPMFAIDVQPNRVGNGYDLHVQGESSTSMTGGFVNQRLFATVPFSTDVKHHIKLEVIDTHGAPGGMIKVTLDGVVIVNALNIPTGWSYVETDVRLGGKKQEQNSYLKLGIYAGNQHRPDPVTLETTVSNFSWSVLGR